MKKILLAAAASMALAGLAAPAVASTYMPVGVQTNVALSTVTGGGWTQCYSSTYGTTIGSDNSIALAGCSASGNLMLAARETGSNTILLLAQAPYADVIFNVGNGNTTHNANGVEWYYSPNFSWGFAQGGDSVSRGQCDTNGTNADKRLCWHTLSFTGGWRAGVNTGLNQSQEFERLIFTANGGGGVVPEPATWAMMIIGFGAAGSMIRRRKAVVA